MCWLHLAAILCLALPARAAEVRVLCDGPALVPVAHAFEAETGHAIRLASATSPELMARLRDGEVADALAIQRSLLDRLAAEGRAAAPRIALGRVGLGLAMRAGAPPVALRDAASLRAALLAADAVIVNDVASGEHFAAVIERLGLAEALQPRIIRTSPAAVFRRLAAGQGRDIGVGTLSQILATPGIALIGPLPTEYQAWLVYDAAPLTAATEPAAARQWIGYLQRPAARAAFAAAGGDPASD